MRKGDTGPDDKIDDKFNFQQSSLMSLGTAVRYEDPRFHLNLVQKKELPSERPIIDSTKWQRLSYYRAFTSADSKTGIITAGGIELTRFLWFYAFNVFFKSLPHGFVHFFVSAYAPEEHMFVSKMVPFCFGVKYLFIITGFLELIFTTDLMIILFYYAFRGIVAKNPWNRCVHRVYWDLELNVTITCYEIEEFAALFENRSYEFWEYTYLDDNQEHFQVAQLEYYRHMRYHISQSEHALDVFVFILIWGAIQMLHLLASKRGFWKVLNYSHWGTIIVDVLTLIYLVAAGSERSTIVKKRYRKLDEIRKPQWYSDNQMLSESITAPHVVHVLTSRSTQEIAPTRDSSTMIISNALKFIFKGIHGYMLQKHCEALVNTEIPVAKFNQLTVFFLLPMFWHSFWLGDIFSVLHISFYFVSEMLINAVTYLCLMEMIIYEWKKLKRWMVMIVFSIAGIFFYLIISTNSRAVLWIYAKGFATLIETICLYIMYPIGRLVDDFTFHYGVPPTQLRILSMRFVPVYYMFKVYFTFRDLWHVLGTDDVIFITHYKWSWVLFIIPILLGMLFTIYKYLVIHRATWTYILRPVPKWGPRDFSVRQLRKQFDSRFYISSEVPRVLSRYVLSKRQFKVYKVDVGYDVQRRSTVSKTVGFGDRDKIKIV